MNALVVCSIGAVEAEEKDGEDASSPNPTAAAAASIPAVFTAGGRCRNVAPIGGLPLPDAAEPPPNEAAEVDVASPDGATTS